MLLQLQLAIKWLFFLPCLQRKSKKKCFSESYFEVDLVNKLQGVIDKQRSQIKKLDQSILDFKAENEEVNLTLIVPIHQLKFDSNIDFKAAKKRRGKLNLNWINPF